MKLLNYDSKYLILNSLRSNGNVTKPITHTKAQYRILCNLIIQKKISRRFFEFVVMEMFDVDDWKQLNYDETYQLIRILTDFDYTKVRM